VRALLRKSSDACYLTVAYLCYFRHWPNYHTPRNFNEHVHRYMLENRNPLLKIVADKITARDWLDQQGEGRHLVPLLGVWDSAEAVPLHLLKAPCVIKPTIGSGSVIFIKDMNFDEQAVREQMQRWLRMDYSRVNREWCYEGATCRIQVEEMLIDQDGGIPADYKVYVIGGAVRFIQIDRGRFARHTRNLYSPQWEMLPARLTLSHHAMDSRPQHLEQMIAKAEKLARSFEFLRIDYYCLGDRLYIGELTNYPGAGFERFIPSQFSEELGSYWTAGADAVSFTAPSRKAA
jgi:hypothetical protein